LACLTFTKSVF